MNRKGFTLIELVLVIVILTMLLLILMPNIITLINKNKTESCYSLKENIISSAKTYVASKKYELGFNCNGQNATSMIEINIYDLIEFGDLKADGDIINPFTDETIENDIVEVTYNCSNKTFDYQFLLNCK